MSAYGILYNMYFYFFFGGWNTSRSSISQFITVQSLHKTVEEWNRQQEEYAQKRVLALRELKNQIALQMDDFKSKSADAFQLHLETAYQECCKDINGLLQEQEAKNADAIQKQEEITTIQNYASLLLDEIKFYVYSNG